MLVPTPPKVEARQMSGFTVKHDQTSIWETISAETNFTCTNCAPIVCVALLGEKELKKELGAPAPGQRDPDGRFVEWQNTSTEYQTSKLKGKLGARPCLSLFRQNSQWSDDHLRGTVRRGANRSCLSEGKICSRPEADGSAVTDN